MASPRCPWAANSTEPSGGAIDGRHYSGAAGAGTGVGEHLAGFRDEEPVVAARAQGHPENAVRRRVANLAVGLHRPEGVARRPAGADDELPDAARRVELA